MRVGVIGADPRGFGARAHIPAVLGSPLLELHAICTAHEDTAREAASRHGARKWYSDVDDLVADPDVDLVIISVRPRYHHQIASASLEAGKLTYCEWPLGRTLDDSAQMKRLAEATGIPTAVGLQGRFSSGIRALRQSLLAGRIGRPLALGVSLLQAPFPVDFDRSWLIDKEEATGALHVAAAHVTDAVQFVLEDVSAVIAITATVLEEGHYADTGAVFTWKTFDTVSFLAETNSGLPMVANVSNASVPPQGFSLRVFGDEGQLVARAAEYFQFSPVGLFVGTTEAGLQEAEVDESDGRSESEPSTNVARALEAFATSAGGRPSDVPSFADGFALHQVIQALEDSARYRRWETIRPT